MLGLHNLRRHQGIFPNEPSVYPTYRHRFEAADVAWFMAGTANDGLHSLDHDSFHPLFDVASEGNAPGHRGFQDRICLEKRCAEVVFDMLTGWDRLTGGITVMCHMDGTSMVRPSGDGPEAFTAEVYMPPGHLNDLPQLQPELAHIVDHFIKTVGMPVVARWTRAFNKLDPSTVSIPTTSFDLETRPTRAFIPRPIHPASSRYHIHGQPHTRVQPGQLDLQTASHPSSSSDSMLSTALETESDATALDDEDGASEGSDFAWAGALAVTDAELTAALQRIALLESELSLTSVDNEKQNITSQREIARLRDDIGGLESDISRHRVDVKSLRAELKEVRQTEPLEAAKLRKQVKSLQDTLGDVISSSKHDEEVQRLNIEISRLRSQLPRSATPSSSSPPVSNTQRPPPLTPRAAKLAATILASREPTSHSASPRPGILISFGPATDQYIRDEALDSKIHILLYRISNDTPTFQWSSVLGSDERIGALRAQGLCSAMFQDVGLGNGLR